MSQIIHTCKSLGIERGRYASDFHRGEKVRYIPVHAKDDIDHSDCEDGIVSSTNDSFVFVKYNSKWLTIVFDGESILPDITSQATNPNDLIHYEWPSNRKMQK